MKYRYYSKLTDAPVPGVFSKDGTTPVAGRCSVLPEDNVGHAFYEIQPQPGTQLTFKSPDTGSQGQFGTNHIYACLNGNGVATVGSDDFPMAAGSILALPPATEAVFSAGSDQMIRIVVIHCQSCSSDPALPNPTYRDLKGIIGTERDIDWTRGRSRRFLIGADGFNLSLHNTTCDPGHASPLCYKTNYESTYYFRGNVTYEWDDGKAEATFKQEDASGGDAVMFLMDENDPHILNTHEVQLEGLCCFFPALKGTETHDFTKKGFSVF